MSYGVNLVEFTIADFVFWVGCIITFFFVRTACKPKAKQYNVPINIVSLAFLVHTAFSFAFWWFSMHSNADAIVYYKVAQSGGMGLFRLGTPFVSFLMVPFSQWFGLSYISVYFVFNILGFLGIFFTYLSARSCISSFKHKRYLNWMLFLPGLNFWSASIGKDAIALFGIGMFAYSIQNKIKVIPLFVGLFAVTMVRPHIGGLMLIAFGIALLLSRNTRAIAKVSVLIGASIGIANVIDKVAGYISLQSISISGVIEYVRARQSFNITSSAGLDYSDASLPWMLFTYLCRPLFYDAQNALQLVSSVENLVYLALFFQLLSVGFIAFLVRRRSVSVIFNLMFLLMAWGVLAVTTTNLGIVVRQKIMILPSLVILLSLYAGRKRVSNRL